MLCFRLCLVELGISGVREGELGIKQRKPERQLKVSVIANRSVRGKASSCRVLCVVFPLVPG